MFDKGVCPQEDGKQKEREKAIGNEESKMAIDNGNRTASESRRTLRTYAAHVFMDSGRHHPHGRFAKNGTSKPREMYDVSSRMGSGSDDEEEKPAM